MMLALTATLLAHADEITPVTTIDVVHLEQVERARKTSAIGKATFATGMSIVGVAGIATAVNLTAGVSACEFECMGPIFAEVPIVGTGLIGATIAIAGGITWGVGDARQRQLTAVVVPYTNGRETGFALSGRF